jgi:hypothetical protein
MGEDTVVFERLPAGRYEVRGLVGNTQQAAVEIDVPRQTEVTIE